MARPRKIDEQLIAAARLAVRRSEDLQEFKQALAVLLPADLNASLDRTAQLLGVGRATVNRFQSRFKQRGDAGGTRLNWGGRRRSLMSDEEEKEFLRPWAEQAQTGGVLELPPIREALSLRLGRKVAASVMYRLMARNGWRKVTTETRDAKSDPRTQEALKKGFRKIWLPY